jgi:hypothetical protein
MESLLDKVKGLFFISSDVVDVAGRVEGSWFEINWVCQV